MGIFDFFKKKKTELKGEEKPNKSEEVKPSELETKSTSESLEGKTIVITGVFENHSRDELKKMIESKGGKASSSVTKNTAFILSGSNMGPKKKLQAEELGIKIIGEDEFIKQYISEGEKQLEVENEENKEIKYEFFDNGNLKMEWTEINPDEMHGEWKLYFENGPIFENKSGHRVGELRKKCQYENGNLLFLEEYNTEGVLIRKGGYEDGKEIGQWQYFDSKSGKQISKDEYGQKWYEYLPDEVINFVDKEEDEEEGVEEFWQVMECTVCVYKNGKEVAQGRLQFELYENIFYKEYGEYERGCEESYLIINGKIVDESDYDEISLVTEYELARFSDIGYATDFLEGLLP